MRYETTRSFEADYRKLSEEHKRRFRTAIRKFNEACDDALEQGTRPRWPRSLRVKAVEGAVGIWEMTWSFTGPDGRATWEWATVEVEGEAAPAVRWRRIGDHSIFKHP